MGYGGPHAAFLSTKENLVRKMPGRIIGLSKDSNGNPALRMALQTREQHIRREKATSNICTAQALLANMAAFYAVYHGPNGLKDIAERTHRFACAFAEGLKEGGYTLADEKPFFDTVTVKSVDAQSISKKAVEAGYNLRIVGNDKLSVSFDETVTVDDILKLSHVFGLGKLCDADKVEAALKSAKLQFGQKSSHSLARKTAFLNNPVFNSYHCETEMLRYMYKLQSKDLSLTSAMIPLGSCTMKVTTLNLYTLKLYF